ncbi:MAG: NAD(+)/NADH kinase [Flavobacteriales bacterium]|jgi:hypothetical protein|nr:NAD(+)/NADH kinase [Flavobacteriales bacterium]
MRIGIHGRLYPAAAAHTVAHILGRVVAAGAVPVVEVGLATRMAEAGVPLTSDMHTMTAPAKEQLDLLISLGGDGSFLDSVAFVGGSGVPMLGINLGRLGFLSNTRIEDVDDTLKAVIQGRFTIVERGLLAMRGLEEFDGRTALNEVSLHKRDGATMIAIHAHLDGQLPQHLLGRWPDHCHAHRQYGLLVELRGADHGAGLRGYDGNAHQPAQPQRAARSWCRGPANSHSLWTRAARKYLVNMDSRSRDLGPPSGTPREQRRPSRQTRAVNRTGLSGYTALQTGLGFGYPVGEAGVSAGLKGEVHCLMNCRV